MIVTLDGIADDQLARPTPCTEYSVGDLIDHVDLVCRGATALAQQAADQSLVPLHLDPRWRVEVAQHVGAVAPAWSDPEVWPRDGNELWAKITLTELVVHAW